MTGRRALAWGLGGVALALAGTGVALVLLPLPPSPRGPEPGRSVYQAYCATCHGVAGRGDSWRARLLLLRPGDLSSPAMASLPDRYLTDLIRHGGPTFGKPGMPSFGFVLSDAEIEAVVQYVRTLARTPRDVAAGGTGRLSERGEIPAESLKVFWEITVEAGEQPAAWPEMRYLDRRLIDSFEPWAPA